MQRGRGGRDPFSGFGNPFVGFEGFGSFGGFGGPGGPRSLISSFFEGRDPFDDPFFSHPFGGMFESSFFGPGGSPFAGVHPTGFIEHQTPEPRISRGPIIEELNSDDEKEETDEDKKGNPRKHGRSSSEPYVKDPDDEARGKRKEQMQYMNDYSRVHRAQPQTQAHSFAFQSSTVTYGGLNGAYHTSSKTRRTGSDGVTVEESREADTASRKATHRISRGLHNKGHTVTRKLNSDGRVDTMQTLHNLNKDDIAGFEKTWDENARKHLPGWPGSFGVSTGAGSSGNSGQASRIGWALPSTDARFMEGPSPSIQKSSGRIKSLKNFGAKSVPSAGGERK